MAVAHLIEQCGEREAGGLEHFFLARRDARHVARQQEVLPVDLNAVTREIDRRLIARLQAIEEKLPLAQEVEPSDIVGLVHVVAEADERFADRFGIVDRFLELLLLGKIVVGVDADHESDALGRVRCGVPQGKQAESQDGNQADHCFPLKPGEPAIATAAMIAFPSTGSNLNRR